MVVTDKEFFDKLEQQPELKNRFKVMLSISTNSGKELITLADEAEYRVIEQVRKLSQELLQGWANKESAPYHKTWTPSLKTLLPQDLLT
ncbi:MAG: hypothetical protein K2X04_08510 [Burkholderiales bacterium]|jgi:hypothetical protein|nr:hypothetical protein [Burkholderiales bacterium]